VNTTFEFTPTRYGSAFANLIGEARLNPLDAGRPNQAVRDDLEALSLDQAFAGQRLKDQDMANACVSAVWLYHNYLDESHTLSQSILSVTGSYWHGIMHRREPDPPNSKYWFRKVGHHAVFDQLALLAAQIVEAAPANPATIFLKDSAGWDPYAFVDLCDAALHGQASVDELCRQIQLLEWQLLFDFSYRQAIEL
jgi:hypothetical protein